LAALVLGVVMTPGVCLAKKQIELSFALYIPAKSSPYQGAFLPWAKEIEKRTDGKVKITFYMSQTLVKARDSYDAVVNGIADISWAANSLTPGRFPLSGVMELPFVSPNTYVGSHAMVDLYNKYPEIQAEYKDVHLLSPWVTLPYELHMVNKPVKTLEDIKGMKFGTLAAARAALEGLGAVPVTMALPKIYQTVEKGVTDGSCLAWGAYNTWKIHEVTKYHTNAHLGGVVYWTAMNKKTWNSLPEDARKVISDVSAEMLPDAICTAVTGEMKKGIDTSKKKGHELYTLPPKEMMRWRDTAKSSWDKWVSEMEAKGLPGSAVLTDALRLVEQYVPQYRD
jgi:TRAP-type C4-dicarboxylate transport system substrate-binding protein